MKKITIYSRAIQYAVCCVVYVSTLGNTDANFVYAGNWPSWRGPDGTRTATATNLPETWGPEKNIAWKKELSAWSGSSPIIWEDRIYIVSPSKFEEPPQEELTQQQQQNLDRRRRRRGQPAWAASFTQNVSDNPGGQNIMLLCISRKDGSMIWEQPFDTGNKLSLKENSSSPSPVTDGKHIFVMSGNGVATCFDLEGNKIWEFKVPEKFGRLGLNFSYASSPVLIENKLVIQVLHGKKTDAPSYVFALDIANGDVLWKVERPTDARDESPDAYTTPAIFNAGGSKQLVILGGDYVTGHDPASGAEIWRSGGLNPSKAGNYRIVPSPIAMDGMIYCPTRRTPLLALKPDGATGDISEKVVWKWEQNGAPDVPSPLCDGEYFYMIDDRGSITCLDAKSGALQYGPQDTGIGAVSASPLLADGKIFIFSETAEAAVIAAGPEFKQLATNQLGGEFTLSSPAAVGEELYIRTGQTLYCIRKLN